MIKRITLTLGDLKEVIKGKFQKNMKISSINKIDLSQEEKTYTQ